VFQSTAFQPSAFQTLGIAPVIGRVLDDGLSLRPDDQTLRSDLTVGLSRARRRTTVRTDRITVQFGFTEAEMSAFRDWYTSDTGAAGGTAWFTGLTLTTGTGATSTPSCRFAAPFTAERRPDARWRMTAELEVRA
jgi:hypothetical protein